MDGWAEKICLGNVYFCPPPLTVLGFYLSLVGTGFNPCALTVSVRQYTTFMSSTPPDEIHTVWLLTGAGGTASWTPEGDATPVYYCAELGVDHQLTNQILGDCCSPCRDQTLKECLT